MAWFDVDVTPNYVAINGKGLGPIRLKVGQTWPLTAKQRNAVHGNLAGAISWTSDTPGVASVVLGTGVVTAAGVGTAKITASDGTRTDSIEVVVLA